MPIPAPGGALSGSLLLPPRTDAQPLSSALLLAGSGPADRDGHAERAPLGIQRALAEALARGGVASLRYDPAPRASVRDYRRQLRQPVDQGVRNDVVGWVTSTLAAVDRQADT